MENKKAEMTIGTIIMIILGIVVLVFLILGFSQGFGNLWDRIINFGGGSTNIDTIVTSCQAACSIGNEYDYCKERTAKFGKEYADKTVAGVKLDSNGISEKMSCKKLEGANVGLDPCSGITKCPEVSVDKECRDLETPGICTTDVEGGCSEAPLCAPDEGNSNICVFQAGSCSKLGETDCKANTNFCNWVDKTAS